jgi:hypothetical protein
MKSGRANSGEREKYGATKEVSDHADSPVWVHPMCNLELVRSPVCHAPAQKAPCLRAPDSPLLPLIYSPGRPWS